MMKIYLSGPMTGYINFNRTDFNECARLLREAGYEVISPAEIADSDNYDGCLKADLIEMLTCDAIVNMRSWGNSRGARLEHMVAIAVGIPCYDFETAMELGPKNLQNRHLDYTHAEKD